MFTLAQRHNLCLRAGVALLGKKMSANQNAER